MADDLDHTSIAASAHHEAGHAVMAWYLGNPILEQGIGIDGRGAGFCNTLRRVKSGELLVAASTGNRWLWQALGRAAEDDVDEWQAGGIAERRYLGQPRASDEALLSLVRTALTFDPARNLPTDDLCVLAMLVEMRLASTGRLVSGPELWGRADDQAVMEAFRVSERRVSDILEDRRTWNAVETLAAALLERRRLSAHEAHALIAGKNPRRRAG